MSILLLVSLFHENVWVRPDAYWGTASDPVIVLYCTNSVYGFYWTVTSALI